MENKIKTKKAMLEVIELVYGIIESHIKDKSDTIDSCQKNLDEMAEDANRWDVEYWKCQIEDNKLWITSASDVIKTLEKMI